MHYSIEIELEPGEKLLWRGRPQSGIFMKPHDLYQIPFTLLWCGFAFFWEWSVVARGAPLLFKLWGIPFVIAGIYLVVGRFWVDAWMREETRYALTDRRIIIASGLFTRKVQSLPLGALSEISVTLTRNGVGTVLFGPYPPFVPLATGISWPGTYRYRYIPPMFEFISDARGVERQVREAQLAMQHSKSF